MGFVVEAEVVDGGTVVVVGVVVEVVVGVVVGVVVLVVSGSATEIWMNSVADAPNGSVTV